MSYDWKAGALWKVTAVTGGTVITDLHTADATHTNADALIFGGDASSPRLSKSANLTTWATVQSYSPGTDTVTAQHNGKTYTISRDGTTHALTCKDGSTTVWTAGATAEPNTGGYWDWKPRCYWTVDSSTTGDFPAVGSILTFGDTELNNSAALTDWGTSWGYTAATHTHVDSVRIDHGTSTYSAGYTTDTQLFCVEVEGGSFDALSSGSSWTAEEGG